MPKLPPLSRPEQPDNLTPEQVRKWNEYWDKVEEEWNLELEQEQRDRAKR